MPSNVATVPDNVATVSVTEQPQRSNAAKAARLLIPFLAGLLVGAFGTAIHRSIIFEHTLGPIHLGSSLGLVDIGLSVGLLVGLALVASAALLVRASLGIGSLLTFGLGLIVAVQVLSLARPGGSVLILDPATVGVRVPILGLIWAYGSALVLLVVMLLPPSWFIERAELAPVEEVNETAMQPNYFPISTEAVLESSPKTVVNFESSEP